MDIKFTGSAPEIDKDYSLWFFGKVATITSAEFPEYEVSIYATSSAATYVRYVDNFESVVDRLADDYDVDRDVVIYERGITKDEVEISDEISEVYFAESGEDLLYELDRYFKDDDEIMDASDGVTEINSFEEAVYATQLKIDEENYFYLRLTTPSGRVVDRQIGESDSHWLSKSVKAAKRLLRECEIFA